MSLLWEQAWPGFIQEHKNRTMEDYLGETILQFGVSFLRPRWTKKISCLDLEQLLKKDTTVKKFAQKSFLCSLQAPAEVCYCGTRSGKVSVKVGISGILLLWANSTTSKYTYTTATKLGHHPIKSDCLEKTVRSNHLNFNLKLGNNWTKA